MRQWETYADRTRDTLVLPDALLAILDLGNTLLSDLLHAHVLLATTKLRCINCDEESFASTLLCVLDVLLGDFSVTIYVAAQNVSNRHIRKGEAMSTHS